LTALPSQVGDLVQIFNHYKEHADFLHVYVREAHPTDEWQMKSNLKEDICYAQPKTLEQRLAIATFSPSVSISRSLRVDDMSNAANDAYAPGLNALYIIDESARIASSRRMGPFHYDPKKSALGSPPARRSETSGNRNRPNKKPTEKPATNRITKSDGPPKS